VAERVLSELGTRQMPCVLFGPINWFWVLSPDEKTLVVRDESDAQIVQLMNLQTSAATLGLRVAPGKSISQCSFDAEGDLVVTVDNSDTAQLWNAKTAEPVGESFMLSTSPTSSQSVYLLKGGRRLLVYNPTGCSLWEPASGKMLESWRLYDGGWQMRVSPDERLMALSQRDSTNNPVH
jgi:hypothetical protein